MLKPHIHFHSDCPFFAGCENMLVNFFESPVLQEKYNVSFSYRYSQAYEEGLKSRVSSKEQRFSLHLLDTSLTNVFKNKYLQVIAKVLMNILLIKYFFVFWNTVVLYRVFATNKVDVLHINNGGYPGAFSCFSAVCAGRLLRIPHIVFVVNNLAVPVQLPKRWVDYPLDRIVANSVSVFITGSRYAGKSLMEVLRISQNQLQCIHNGIKPRNLIETKEQVFKRLGIPHGKLVIAVVAVLEERKGHIYLIKAMEILKARIGETSLPFLVVEGKGSQLDFLIEYASSTRLSEHIKFIGSESNVYDLINSVDVIVLPSIANEDFPNVTLEAMSLGKLVIASKIAGVPEQIEHMKNGILVEPQNIDELVEALLLVQNNPAIIKELGEAAHLHFYKHFTSDIAVSRYIEVYDSLIQDRGVFR